MTQHGYERHAFADGVRREVYDALERIARLGVAAIPDDVPPELRELLTRGRMSEVWAKPTTPVMRRILQLWGTEYRRAQDANYWIGDLIRHLYPGRPITISDVRFPNEVAWVRQHGVCWNIVRPSGFYRYADQTLAQHTSETLLHDTQFDEVIVNDGTLDDLHKRVVDALKHSDK